MANPRFKVPDTALILATIGVLAAVLTWIVPPGAYERTEITVPGVGTREVVVPGTFIRHRVVLAIFVLGIAVLVWGVLPVAQGGFGWYIVEIAALFVVMGVRSDLATAARRTCASTSR